MKSALKWFLLFPLLIFFFLFLKVPVFAAPQTQPTNTVANQYLAPNTNPDVPRNLHTFTQSLLIEIMSSAICQLSGFDPISKDHKCLGVDPSSGKIGFVQNGGGAIGGMGSLIASTYRIPVSSSNYLNYMASNFGIAKKTYAQTLEPNPCASDSHGIGFCSLQPLTTMWVYMRNVAYLLFTVIFIIIGVAIMLRVHIDPRTVMTIENQIPKIIIGILLVTFSLAIAGLLIDLMYVSIYLIGNVLSRIVIDLAPTATPQTFLEAYNKIVSSSNPFQALGQMGSFAGIVSNIAAAFTNTIIGSLFSGAHTPFTITIGFCPICLQEDIGAMILWIILWLIFLFALLIALFRVWITLIIAYVTILLDVVFAPFWFLGGLLPGSSIGVGAWFRDMIANLAVFPATITMFLLGMIFSFIGGTALNGIISVPTGTTPTSNNLFNPPLVGGFGSAAGAATLGGLIQFGFIFMTPQILSIIKSAIKAPKINLGPIFAPVSSAAGIISGPPRRAIGGTISEVTRRRIVEKEPDDPFWKKATRAVSGRS